MGGRARRATNTKPSVDGFVFVGAGHGFEEFELQKNGLRVLYKNEQCAPVAGVMVTYLVGSKHEATGYTGATHLLEHLMFKGSKHFPKKNGMSVIDRLEEKGAVMNATTWLDRTNYFEVFPEEHLAYVLAIEADRMRNARITQKDLTEEMPAVRSEYAMGDNDPYEVLDTHLHAMAFMAHPYHHSTIGWLSDIENVPLERLQRFYDTYYWPNNAYLTLITRVDRATALRQVRQAFGVHPPSRTPIPIPYTAEPSQLGKRFVEVHRSGSANLFGIGFKVPEAQSKDTHVLKVLAHVLGEGTRTSRLHRALVDTKLATSASVLYTPSKDPSLFRIFVKLASGVSHAQVERVVLEVCADVATRGITKAELAHMLAHITTQLAFARDGHLATLGTLNEAIAVGDWRLYFDLPAQVKKVSVTDVRRVAQTYLTEKHGTTGHYHATN